MELTIDIIHSLEKYVASSILKQPGRGIGAHEPILTSGLIDSFSLVDLALFVEDTYGVRVEDTELNSSTFDTLAQLAELIRSRQSP